MADSPEQIENFEKTIEESLERQIEILQMADLDKSVALRSIKKLILIEIKKDRDDKATPELEEKYSTDLRLTEEELNAVFEEVKNQAHNFFFRSEIKSFTDFKNLIGLEDHPVVGSLQESVFGIPIRIDLSPGVTEDEIRRYTLIFKQIEERKDLEPYITSETVFTFYATMKVEFTVIKDGKSVKYLAMPGYIFRVDQEPPPEKIKEWKEKRLKQINLTKNLRETIAKDKTVTEIQKAYLEEVIHLSTDWSANVSSRFVPKKYRTKIKEIGSLTREIGSLGKICFTRMLFDEVGQIKVEEIVDVWDNVISKYLFLRENGDVQKTVKYSREDVSVTEFSQNKQIQREASFDKNGKITVESLYEENGSKSIFYYRDGTLSEARKGDDVDLYDETGKYIIFQRFKSASGKMENLVLGLGGSSLGSFEFEKSRNPEISEYDYLEKFKKTIKTKKQFIRFEENFMDDLNFSENSVIQIRLHGREVTGVAEKERQLESKYSIQIETEELLNHDMKANKRFAIHNLDWFLIGLEKKLEEYPPVFIKNSGLKRVYIFMSLAEDGPDATRTPIGGYSLGEGQIVLSTLNSFYHELFHCIDWIYGGMSNDNAEWGGRAHGEGFEKLYGKSGFEAIKLGKMYGDRPEGHASAYGKHGGIDEDQADVAEALMNNYLVLGYADKEPALAEKIKMVKEFYYALSGGKMDEKYWKDKADRKKIDAAYWEKREKAQDFVATPEWEKVRREFELFRDLKVDIKMQYWDKVHSSLSALLANNPEKASVYHAEVIYGLDGLGNITEEERLILEFSKKYPERPEYYVTLGHLYKVLRKEDEAQGQFLLAIEKGSTDPYIFMMVLTYHRDNAKWGVKVADIALVKQKAIKVYESVPKDDPDVIYSLAYLYYSVENDLEKAKATFLLKLPEDVRINPDHIKHKKALAAFYGQLIRDTLKEDPQKYPVRESNYEPVITSSFLDSHPEISRLHREKINVLEKICANGYETGSPDFEYFKELVDAYCAHGKFELALRASEKVIGKFDLVDSHYQTVFSRRIIGIHIIMGNPEKAVKVYMENFAENTYMIESYAIDFGALPENIMVFYERLLPSSKNSIIYLNYLSYLKDQGRFERLAAVITEAKMKFPKESENFDKFR